MRARADVWAIVPAKEATTAKSRLARALSPGRRAALVASLLRHVLITVRRAAPRAGLAGGIVVSRDPRWLTLAARHGFLPLVETGPGELNAALNQAVRAAVRLGANGVLILSLDLPRLVPADVVALTAQLPRRRGMIIAPDEAGTGTNALVLRPATLIPPAFGPNSARRHVALARQSGTVVHVVRRPGLSQDVDQPKELDRAVALTPITEEKLPSPFSGRRSPCLTV
ncbi:MAG: 2-phospho-L-lactate guanylyltransferase [Ardenticatenia bacterium]|nr:2-phospho-L-lactate guanylyltransferase [Ardenticatenia bacterium]